MVPLTAPLTARLPIAPSSAPAPVPATGSEPSAPAGTLPPRAAAGSHASGAAAASPSAPAPGTPRTGSPVLAAELVCPRQVRPDMPALAIEEGIGGTVVARARVLHGRVDEVSIVSGPRVFHATVRRAMLRYRCEDLGDRAVTVTQEFSFRLR